MCRRGNASKQASEYLKNQLKIDKVINLEGGIEEYGRNYDDQIVFI